MRTVRKTLWRDRSHLLRLIYLIKPQGNQGEEKERKKVRQEERDIKSLKETIGIICK